MSKLILPSSEPKAPEGEMIECMSDDKYTTFYEQKEFFCYFVGERMVNLSQVCERLRDAMEMKDGGKAVSRGVRILLKRLDLCLERSTDSLVNSERRRYLREALLALQNLAMICKLGFAVHYLSAPPEDADPNDFEEPKTAPMAAGTGIKMFAAPQQQVIR